MATVTKEKAEVILIEADAILYNHALFERDAFKSDKGGAPGKAMYKVEVGFNPKDVEAFEDRMADIMDREFGKGSGDKFLNGDAGYISPFLSGDDLAAARAEKGKEGDAYKGKLVLRAKTGFNKDGIEGPGGCKVYGPQMETIGIVEGNQAEVYNGCIGQVAVTLKTYTDYPRRGDKGITAYLVAFQKRADGTPLKSSGGDNTSALFKPVNGNTAAPAGERRRRAG